MQQKKHTRYVPKQKIHKNVENVEHLGVRENGGGDGGGFSGWEEKDNGSLVCLPV